VSPVHEGQTDKRDGEAEQVVEDVGVDQPVGGAVAEPGTIHCQHVLLRVRFTAGLPAES